MAKYVTALFNHWVTPTVHITKGEKYDINDPNYRAVYESHREWFSAPETPAPRPKPEPGSKPERKLVQAEERGDKGDRLSHRKVTRTSRRRADSLKPKKADDES